MNRAANRSANRSAWTACSRVLQVALAVGVLAIVVVGCTLNGTADDTGNPDDTAAGSGGTSGGSSSGVPRSTRLMDLGAAQASVLCDWTNLKQGGYGRSTICPSGSLQSTNSSNQDCVNRTSALGGQCVGITVGNIEDCANAVGTDLCAFETAAACSAVFTCPM